MARWHPDLHETTDAQKLARLKRLFDRLTRHYERNIWIMVGVIGTAARRSFAAIGDPVNTGARLQTAAEPGQVVVGRLTWESLGDPAAGVALGPVRVKGKREPVEAWRLHVPGGG